MPPPLTIRNLTSVPITLKLIERYEAPTSGDSSSPVENVTRNFTSLMSNATSLVSGGGGDSTPKPSGPRLAENAKSFTHRDVDIHIGPFKAHKTDIKATERSDHEVLRLTIEVAGGERYRIDTPALENESQTFRALHPNPRRSFTGVFVPEDTFLAIYDSNNLHCWMRSMKDETPLSALSIPGTHNSPTCHKALPSVRCQAVTPREQLDNGVRFFDIRVQPASKEDFDKGNTDLTLVHGVFPISLTGSKNLRDLLKEVYEFLDANPSECLIMSLKKEGTGNATDQQLGRTLFDHYTSKENARRWYTDPKIPTLGQVRGKVVLLRRFAIGDFVKNNSHEGRGYGINAESWADNTPHDLHGQICVQDFYEVLETENIDKKIKYSQDQLARAAELTCHLPGITTDKVNPVPPHPFYINFLSASNFWKKGCWPEKIAAKLNPAVIKWLCKRHDRKDGREDAEDCGHGDGGTGIVVLDWVGDRGDWDIVRCIVGWNSKLMMREMKM